VKVKEEKKKQVHAEGAESAEGRRRKEEAGSHGS
jgi:hypothetical protein